MPFRVGDEFFDRNRAMAIEWMELATESETFVWEGESDADWLLTVIQYWRNLSQVRHDLQRRGETYPMDADAERFAQALRRAILDALVAAGRLTADHADRLHATWPVLSGSAAGDGDVPEYERHAGGPAW